MENIKKSKVLLAIICGLVILASQSVYAAWSDYGTFSITDDPKMATTTGNWLGASKFTVASEFSVFASSKTMYSTPSVRLVNSDGEVRSSFVGISSTNTTYTGTGNTGQPNFMYFAQVKPAWNQSGTDTITLRHDPK